jgi:flagellar hook-associated protein 3 FlgL
MRVTESLKYATITSQLGQLRQQYMQASQQSSSGKRLNAPSDDPIAAAADARIQASLSQNEAHRNTISSVQGDVQLAESSLDSAGQVLQRALELAMSGANGASGEANLKSLGIEANQLVDQMISIGNTKGSQGYLFGGTRTNAAPFGAGGNFVGNDKSQLVTLDGGPPMTVNVSGANAFANVNGRDVIQDLKDLASALSSGDSDAVRATLDGLQSSHSQVVQERANAGLILDRLTLTDSFLVQKKADLTAQSSALTDADVTATLSTLSQLGTTIQQAVAVDQKLLQLSTVTLSG